VELELGGGAALELEQEMGAGVMLESLVCGVTQNPGGGACSSVSWLKT
jgi:hypothetical protein